MDSGFSSVELGSKISIVGFIEVLLVQKPRSENCRFVQPTGQKGLIPDFGRSRPPDYCLIIFKVNLWYRFRVNGDFISRALKVGSRRLVKHHLRENSPSMASEASRAPRYTVPFPLAPQFNSFSQRDENRA